MFYYDGYNEYDDYTDYKRIWIYFDTQKQAKHNIWERVVTKRLRTLILI